MSSEIRIYTYEAMFLFSQGATADLSGTIDHIKSILTRADAEIISMGKWAESRLAFDIKGNKRGLYIICYFRAPADKMVGFERDCNLSERILRTMVLRADAVPEEMMQSYGDEQRLLDEAALRAEEPAETPREAPAEVTTKTPAKTPSDGDNMGDSEPVVEIADA